MVYQPDGWMLVKIGGQTPHYRVFGSWAGGYLDGDAWRLNSGVESCEKDGEYYVFHGGSGSVYRCHESTYGRLTAYNYGVLNSYQERAQGTFATIDEMPDIMEISWK